MATRKRASAERNYLALNLAENKYSYHHQVTLDDLAAELGAEVSEIVLHRQPDYQVVELKGKIHNLLKPEAAVKK